VAIALNMDMIGRLREDNVMIVGMRSGYGLRHLLSIHNDASNLHFQFVWGLKGNADHFPFTEHDIPALLFHTGVHPEYHRPSDAAKLINRSGMERVARMVFELIYDLADRPEDLPGFRAAARQETPETEKDVLSQSSKPADRLGVGWFEDAAATGGVKVTVVSLDSPAEKAGLQAGDCIVKFSGEEIHSDDDFFGAVCTAESPAAMTVKRPGEEKPLDFSVRLLGSPLRWGILWRVDDAEPETVILTHVVPGSPAALAGLAAEDRIYQVGGKNFSDEAGFALLAKTLSQPVQLLVERDGRLRTVVLRPRQVEPLKRAA
jgi:membrane-associated protease RseP (regulator of RpoE activity)